MSTQHTQQMDSFRIDETILKQYYANLGISDSSSYYSASRSAYLSRIQSFIDNSLSYIQAVKQLPMAIDKAALTTLLNNYDSSDYGYACSHYNTSFVNTYWPTFYSETKTSLDSKYADARYRLAAL